MGNKNKSLVTGEFVTILEDVKMRLLFLKVAL